MNDFPDDLEPQEDLAKPSFARTAASLVLMLIGVGATVGTCILFFYLKAFHVEPFPSAWKLIVFVGMCVSLLALIPAMLLARALLNWQNVRDSAKAAPQKETARQVRHFDPVEYDLPNRRKPAERADILALVGPA